jgi:biotin carboxylase
MVKPVDSAGSTGVVKVEKWSQFEEAFLNALKLSTEKIVIVEEYIQMNHECMIAGDAFVLNGKVEFMGLLNSHRGAEEHPFIPTGTSYPIFLNSRQVDEVSQTVQKVVDLLGIQFGGLNLELMYDNKGDLYIIEIAPRNGGNLIPELLNTVTGIDLIGALVDASVGITDINLRYNKPNSYYATYVLHSNRNGRLKEIKYGEGIKNNIIRKVIHIKNGEEVLEFDNAKKAIGILFLKFDSLEEEQEKLKNIKEYIDIVLED